MSNADEVFGVMAEVTNENTTDQGIDIVNVYATLVNMLKADPNMTVEMWETFRLSMSNGIAILNNLIDEEIARLQAETST